jgi:hypothetical protein
MRPARAVAGLGRLWRVWAGETEWHVASFCEIRVRRCALVRGRGLGCELSSAGLGGFEWVCFARGGVESLDFEAGMGVGGFVLRGAER